MTKKQKQMIEDLAWEVKMLKDLVKILEKRIQNLERELEREKANTIKDATSAALQSGSWQDRQTTGDNSLFSIRIL